jgi:hypothetical protein
MQGGIEYKYKFFAPMVGKFSSRTYIDE